MKIAMMLWLVFASVPLVDAEEQPECRARCEQVYAAERNACGEGYGADECRDGADDRHQECIDRCND